MITLKQGLNRVIVFSDMWRCCITEPYFVGRLTGAHREFGTVGVQFEINADKRLGSNFWALSFFVNELPGGVDAPDWYSQIEIFNVADPDADVSQLTGCACYQDHALLIPDPVPSTHDDFPPC